MARLLKQNYDTVTKNKKTYSSTRNGAASAQEGCGRPVEARKGILNRTDAGAYLLQKTSKADSRDVDEKQEVV